MIPNQNRANCDANFYIVPLFVEKDGLTALTRMRKFNASKSANLLYNELPPKPTFGEG